MGINKLIFIDVETYSTVNLLEVSSYKYGEADNKPMIVSISYSSTDSPSIKYSGSLTYEALDYLIQSINDGYKLVAHNAVFEFNVLKNYISNLELSSFICTSWLSVLKGGKVSLNGCAYYWKLNGSKFTCGKSLITKYHKFFDAGGELKDYKKTEDFELLCEYNEQDTALCRQLLYKILSLRPLTSYDKQEYQYWLDSHIMNTNGIPIDIARCEDMLKASEVYETKIKATFEKIYLFNPRSNPAISKWLNARKSSITIKVKNFNGPYTKKESTTKPHVNAVWYSLSDEVKDMFNLKHKYPSGTIKRLGKVKDMLSKDNRLRGLIHHFEAITGRISSKNFNILNIPRYSKSKGLWDKSIFYGQEEGEVILNSLRSLIKPKEGTVFVISDLAQIEFRILMHFAGHTEVLDKLSSGVDIYMELADDIYGKDVKRSKSSIERHTAKTGTLSSGYGASAGMLHSILNKDNKGVPIQLARKILYLYNTRYPKVRELVYRISRFLNAGVPYKGPNFKLENNYMLLPSGRKMYIRDINRKINLCSYTKDFNAYPLPAHIAIAWLCQGTARDIIHSVQSKCIKKSKELKFFKVLYNEYDKVILEVKEDKADEVAKNLKSMMINAVSYLKLDTDTEIISHYK